MPQAPQSGHLTVPISDDAARKQLITFIRLLRSASHVDNASLDILGIKCTDIDIETGMPSDNGPRVLELAPPMNPIDMIPREGSKDLFHDDALHPSDDPEYYMGNLHEARFLAYFFQYSLFNCVSSPTNRSIRRSSPWEYFEIDPDPFISKFKGFYTVFRLELQDKSFPDLICYTATEAPPKDDELFTSELLCIMRLGLGRVRAEIFRGRHQTAAVTVISGSGRMIRVVQGCVDNNKGTVLVRKSKFINVNDEDMEKNLEKLMHIARWVLGYPCRK